MKAEVPAFDALILAGGRSSRLGGVPKQHLRFKGATLLERALAAASGARRVVVVGPDPGPLPDGVLSCREQPEFAGPAAAIGAGLDLLSAEAGSSRYTLVLACDMPLVGEAVRVLALALASSAGGHPQALLASADDGGPEGRIQPLAGFYSTAVLTKSVQELAAKGGLINGSVRALLASLDVQLVMVPATATADVDTWDDAAALGVAAGDQDQDQAGAAAVNLGGSS